MTRTFPYYGWLGAVIVLVPEAGIFARIQPFVVWHTPIAGAGSIRLINALVRSASLRLLSTVSQCMYRFVLLRVRRVNPC